MGYEHSRPGWDRNYIDCGRVHECQHAWLIERRVDIPNASYDHLPKLSWWDGLGWTRKKDDALRFTRWVDAARVIDHVLPPPVREITVQATYHDDLEFRFSNVSVTET
jgi:hypothetical protein